MNQDPDINSATPPGPHNARDVLSRAVHANRLNPPPASWREEILAAAGAALPGMPATRHPFASSLRRWGMAALWLLSAGFTWETHRLNSSAPVLNQGSSIVLNPPQQDWAVLFAAIEKHPAQNFPNRP